MIKGLIIPIIFYVLLMCVMIFVINPKIEKALKQPVLTNQMIEEIKLEIESQLEQAEKLIKEGKADEAQDIIDKIPKVHFRKTLESEIEELRKNYNIGGK